MATLLSVNSYFYRRDGSEAVYLDHNRLFAARGWDVVPFAMQHPNNLPTPWSNYFVSEIEFGGSYSLWDKIVRVPKVIYSFEARRKLGDLLKRIRPDVAHCHSIYHHISPSILGVLKQAGIPTVMTLHDLKLACPAYHMFVRNSICEQCRGGKLHSVMMNRCIKDSVPLSALIMLESALHKYLGSYAKNVSRFIAPCAFYIEKLVSWGWQRDQFVHIPNFVETRSLQPRFVPGKSFLYFGRLSPEKGLLTLLQAAARARVAVRFAGAGPQLAELRAQAEKLGADAVFLGHLSGTALLEEIRSSRATVLPSQWYENAPMSILESYALGKPAIGADIGGIPELIRHAATGWIFDSGSVDQLAAILRRAADTPDGRLMDMGRAARQLVETEFSAERYCERITGLYSRLGVQP